MCVYLSSDPSPSGVQSSTWWSEKANEWGVSDSRREVSNDRTTKRYGCASPLSCTSVREHSNTSERPLLSFSDVVECGVFVSVSDSVCLSTGGRPKSVYVNKMSVKRRVRGKRTGLLFFSSLPPHPTTVFCWLWGLSSPRQWQPLFPLYFESSKPPAFTYNVSVVLIFVCFCSMSCLVKEFPGCLRWPRIRNESVWKTKFEVLMGEYPLLDEGIL